MAGNGVERRLAAILSADVVGYSRLMEADEEATIHALGACRQIIDELVESHHGRVFGSAGDSVIAEFASPIEAVNCASDIQRELENRNVDQADDRRMQLRIGINLGDVVVKGDDLLGDGVNVSARLQALADPGGICLSGTVFDLVDGKLDLQFEYLGMQEVKNITKPIRVYRSAAPSATVEIGVTRKLTAVLHADFVGYSRRTGEDDIGTHHMLSTGFDIVSEEIAKKGGRVVHYAGDAVQAEFSSAVAAVEGAVSIQRQIEQVNASVPDDMRFHFCIGVNLGEVIIDRNGIYGVGAIVAEMLEGMAKPGGICISGSVHEQVEDKLDLAFEDMGHHEAKNIAKPVRVYRWVDDAADAKPAMAEVEGALPLLDKPSIAVLPFTNMSGDPEQEYFSDGITEDIITELSRFRSLFVIARNSSFAFKEQSVNVGKIGQELGVQYVVEGSVRKAGNRVRITAQLVEAESGNHLWAERYDRDLDDIFAVQDEVTISIVTAIEPTLGSAERGRAHRKPTERLDAWESYQRGLWHSYRFTAADNTEAQSFFRRAIEFDPNFAPAHAGLAYAINTSVLMGFGADPTPALGEARAAAERALTLDGDDALAHFVVGWLHVMLGEHKAAISACTTAVALNPNLATAHYGLGGALAYSGRYEDGIVELDEAIRLSPRDPMLWGFLIIKALACIAMERYEESLELARAAQRQPNATVWAYAAEAVALAQLDRIGEARQALERVHAIKPDFDLNFVAGMIKQIRAVGFEFYLDGLKKAGLDN